MWYNVYGIYCMVYRHPDLQGMISSILLYLGLGTAMSDPHVDVAFRAPNILGLPGLNPTTHRA